MRPGTFSRSSFRGNVYGYHLMGVLAIIRKHGAIHHDGIEALVEHLPHERLSRHHIALGKRKFAAYRSRPGPVWLFLLSMRVTESCLTFSPRAHHFAFLKSRVVVYGS